MRRLLITVIIVILIGIGLYYFSSQVTYPTGKTIKIGTLHGGLSSLDMIKYMKLDKEYDVDLKIIYFEKTLDIYNSLLKGDIDVAIIPIEVAAKVIEDGGEIYIIAADMYQNQKLIVRSDLNITDARELKEIKIGVFTPTGTYAMFKSYLYRIYGFNENDLKLVNLPPSLMVQSILSNKVDMIVIWEPLASKALAKGCKVFKTFKDLWKEATKEDSKPIMIVYAARKDFVDNRYDLVSKLLDMRLRAVERWYRDFDAVRNMLKEYYNLDDKTIDILYKNVEFYKARLIVKDDIHVISLILRLAYEGGYLKSDLSKDISKYILTD